MKKKRQRKAEGERQAGKVEAGGWEKVKEGELTGGRGEKTNIQGRGKEKRQRQEVGDQMGRGGREGSGESEEKQRKRMEEV